MLFFYLIIPPVLLHRVCLDILKRKVAKIIPSVYQKTDKIQVNICFGCITMKIGSECVYRKRLFSDDLDIFDNFKRKTKKTSY
jgi:hypothetical protein